MIKILTDLQDCRVQILKRYGKKGFRLDSRLPITLPILNALLRLRLTFLVLTIRYVNLKLCAH